MAGLFKKQTPAEKTVLLIDVENGSVGCALVRLPGKKKDDLPKLFAETRIMLPMMRALDLERLRADTDKALRGALIQTSATASTMRNHPKLASIGTVLSATVFVSAPWTTARVQGGSLTWDIDPKLQALVYHAITDIFGGLDVSFFATSAAIAHATDHLFEAAPHLLVCTITGEVTELGMLQGGVLTSRATIPVGKHFFIRTLSTHAGLSHPEAHSALQLARNSTIETPVEEALHAAGAQFAALLSGAAGELHTGDSPQGILIVAQEPLGEVVAHILAHQPTLMKTFADGTTLQALHAHHVTPYLAAHAAKPDIVFMTEALFINHSN